MYLIQYFLIFYPKYKNSDLNYKIFHLNPKKYILQHHLKLQFILITWKQVTKIIINFLIYWIFINFIIYLFMYNLQFIILLKIFLKEFILIDNYFKCFSKYYIILFFIFHFMYSIYFIIHNIFFLSLVIIIQFLIIIMFDKKTFIFHFYFLSYLVFLIYY